MKRLIIYTIFIAASVQVFSQSSYPKVKFETTSGNMVLLLYDNTPLHSDNFVKLVNEGYYNGQLFHRVIKDFMIQGGDPDSKGAQPGQSLGRGGPGYTVPAEFKPEYFHKKGALAAARQGDNVNPQRASSGSQFYIVQGKPLSYAELNAMEQRGMHVPFTEEQKKIYSTQGGTPHLDYSYTVFGELIEGLDVLDKIASQPVDRSNRPLQDIKIIKAYTVKK